MDVRQHYDLLIAEGNDPARDPEPLAAYMDKWDGRTFLELLELSPDKRALEIGVGTGRLVLRTAARLKWLTGIDLSPRTIERAAENLTHLSNVDLICGDFLTHPFAENYDLIYSSLTFLHISDKQAAIEKAARLLLPGGILAISLDKSRENVLDYGTRKLRVYPDDPADIVSHIKVCGLIPQPVRETEFAWLVSAIHP